MYSTGILFRFFFFELYFKMAANFLYKLPTQFSIILSLMYIFTTETHV